MSRAATTAVFLLVLAGGCQRGAPGQNVSQGKPKVESDLAYTTLTKADADSLQVELKPAVVKPVQEHVALTGWIMAKQGNEVTVTAPVAGFVRADGLVPITGQTLGKDAALFALEPVLTPLEAIQLAGLKRNVENDLSKAISNLAQAEKDLLRIKDLGDVKAKQDFEKAELQVKLAAEDVAAAKDKQKYFTLETMHLRAPQAGSVLTVHVSPGQFVPAAAPLVTIIDLNPIWVRVPVPEHDFPNVHLKQPVNVSPWSLKGKNGQRSEQPLSAHPVGLVPQVDPVRRTTDLVYELKLPADKKGPALPNLVKDQMVTVQVPLGPEQKESVVPYSAIIFDAHGGTWVYVFTGKIAPKDETDVERHKYERRRVELPYMIGDQAVIRPTLAPTDQVVTRGAALLFSREFYKTPVKP